MKKSLFSKRHDQLRVILRQARLNAGLRQIDLARRLALPQSFVSKYESGERRLDLVELEQVCHVLGITLSELVRRFEEAR